MRRPRPLAADLSLVLLVRRMALGVHRELAAQGREAGESADRGEVGVAVQELQAGEALAADARQEGESAAGVARDRRQAGLVVGGNPGGGADFRGAGEVAGRGPG